MNIICKMKDILSIEINRIISDRPDIVNENTLSKSVDLNEEEEDEYWSDFSDEDFDIEDLEEKEALSTLYHLQSWVQTLNLDINQILKNFEKIKIKITFILFTS